MNFSQMNTNKNGMSDSIANMDEWIYEEDIKLSKKKFHVTWHNFQSEQTTSDTMFRYSMIAVNFQLDSMNPRPHFYPYSHQGFVAVTITAPASLHLIPLRSSLILRYIHVK